MVAEDAAREQHVPVAALEAPPVDEPEREARCVAGHQSRSPISAAYARYDAAAMVDERPWLDGSHSVSTASAYGLRSGRYTSPASCAMVEMSPVLCATFASGGRPAGIPLLNCCAWSA